MSKVFINAGHGGRDSGAVGFVVEKNVNLIMAKAAKEYLEKNNVEVYMHEDDLSDKSQNSTDVINACESFKPDIAIDCHANAGGGKGFEIYKGISGLGDKLAEYIEDEVKKIGQNSRGIKTRKGSNGKDYYYFIRQTSCPAVICEAAFVDNKADAEMLNTEARCKKFGEAYARGILRYFNIKDCCSDKTENKPEKKPMDSKDKSESKSYLVKITADCLNIRFGPGTTYKKVGEITDHGVYTIVEEAAGNDAYKWGKLKSGAGWIALDYTKKI